MKFFKMFLVAAGIMAFFFSCSKTDGTVGDSVGTLKSNDTTGDCLPVIVHGTYTAGVPLIHADNYIDVTINVTVVGNYSITTDSINGMLFKGSGRLGYTGINRVRLYGSGKPLLPGLATFTVEYNGTNCTVSMIVGGLPPGAFVVADSAGKSLGPAVVSGIYTTGVALSSPDSVVIILDVQKAGSIYISSNTIDGIVFTGTGIYTATGIQTLTLSGNGIPLAAGTFNFTVLDSLSDTSKFSITVAPYGGGTPAVFSLGGAPGGCAGFIEYGAYLAGTKISLADSVTTEVTVTKGGPYSIVTAPVNGVVFSTTGTFDSAGIYTVTLKGSGTPLAPGSFNYTATGDSSTCTFSIIYGQGNAVYSLGGSPGACTGFVLNGVYKTDNALTTNNTVTMEVNVVTPGTYTIATPTIDGITFSATGNFTTTGIQLVTLTGTGTPTAPGIFNFATASRSGSCLFTINVESTYGGFTLNNGPYGDCTGSKLYGTYKAGTALATGDSVTVGVNVTQLGIYTLTTDTANGMIFTGSGVFTKTGSQNVTLYGKGKPVNQGGTNFIVMGDGSTCSLSVIVAAGGSGGNTSAFTFGGSPGNCAGFVLAGTYAAGTMLTASNTATVQVNVTTAGTYSISTGNPVNGISFSTSGTFTTTGVQTVVLKGSGTPASGGPFNYTASNGTSTCIFSVTSTGTTIAANFSCKINGVATTFNVSPSALLTTGSPQVLTITGGDASGTSLSLGITQPTGSIGAGTYNQNGLPNYAISASYLDASSAVYIAGSSLNSINIIITSLSGGEIKGTFTGTLKNNNGAGPTTITITEGAFDLPY